MLVHLLAQNHAIGYLLDTSSNSQLAQMRLYCSAVTVIQVYLYMQGWQSNVKTKSYFQNVSLLTSPALTTTKKKNFQSMPLWTQLKQFLSINIYKDKTCHEKEPEQHFHMETKYKYS